MSGDYEHDRFAEIAFHLKRGPVILAYSEWLAYVVLPERVYELTRRVSFSLRYESNLRVRLDS